MIERLPDGRWAPGASPNPGGRPKSVRQVVELARQRTELAIETLEHIARNGRNESARVAAATALLDRAWGKVTDPDEVRELMEKMAEIERILAARGIAA